MASDSKRFFVAIFPFPQFLQKLIISNYGVQTLRGCEDFQITDQHLRKEFIETKV